VNIGGNLSVSQFSSNKTITTTNYQLVVAEDLSLNGRLFVSGNVGIGIGTTNPQTILSTGTLSTNIKLALYDDGVTSTNLFGIGANNSAITFSAGQSISANPQMVLNNSGCVGIGTTLPAYTLDVSAASRAPFRVGVGSTNAIAVNSSGNVGIGTTNPQSALDVSGAIRVSGGITPTYTSPSFSAGQVGYITTSTVVTNSLPNATTTILRQMTIVQPGIYLIESLSLTTASLNANSSMGISITFPNGGGSMAQNALNVYFGQSNSNIDWPLTGIATITGSNTQVNYSIYHNIGFSLTISRLTFQATRIA